MEKQESITVADFNNENRLRGAPSFIELSVFFGLTFTGFIALDVSIPMCFDKAWSAVIMMNLVVGQLTLICVWGTLVEGTFWVRLPWTVLLLVISWAAICYGIYLENYDQPPLFRLDSAEVLGLGLIWFYGFAISYIPLKVAAWLFGWRITQGSVDADDDAPAGQHSIRDMMIGTGLLAVTMAIGRLLVPGDLPTWAQILRASGLDNSTSPVALFIFSMVSLAVKLPCIWIALAVSRSKIQVYAISWILIAGVMGLVELGLLIVFLGAPGGSELFEFIVGLVVGHMGMATIMIGVLVVLRRFGYSMKRHKRNHEAMAS